MGTVSDEAGVMMMVAMDPEASEEENMKLVNHKIRSYMSIVLMNNLNVSIKHIEYWLHD